MLSDNRDLLIIRDEQVIEYTHNHDGPKESEK